MTTSPIVLDELEDMATYDAHRNERLRDMQAHKAPRRMALADDVSLLWESRRTVRHQVQEMVRMEGDDDGAVASILDEYAELVPSPERWTATLSVEVREASRIKQRLGYYAGLEHAFALKVGDRVVPARILGDHGTEEATTAVTYLAFDVGLATDDTPITLVVDHPRLQWDGPVPDAVRTEPA